MKNHFLESKIAEARQMVADVLPEEILPQACIYFAVALNKVLGAPIMAGSYSWKMTSIDNGKNPTHFSCIFDQVAQQKAIGLLETPSLLANTALPEMHVWNHWHGKVLDISTRYVPTFAQKTCGFFFEDQLRPPVYLWADPIHRTKRWVYIPSPLGTQLARLAGKNVMENLSKVRARA